MLHEYRDYFHAVASGSAVLRHEDRDGERAFDFVGLEESFGVLRDGVRPQSFIMRLVRPRRSFDREESGTFASLQGGFLVARFGDSRMEGGGAIIDAQDASLQLSDAIAARMVADSRAGHPLFVYCADRADMLDWNAEPVEGVGDGTYHGYFITFRLRRSWNQLSTCAEDDWIDDGLTDY